MDYWLYDLYNYWWSWSRLAKEDRSSKDNQLVVQVIRAEPGWLRWSTELEHGVVLLHADTSGSPKFQSSHKTFGCQALSLKLNLFVLMWLECNRLIILCYIRKKFHSYSSSFINHLEIWIYYKVLQDDWVWIFDDPNHSTKLWFSTKVLSRLVITLKYNHWQDFPWFQPITAQKIIRHNDSSV